MLYIMCTCSCPILDYSNIKTISVWKHIQEENEKRPLYRNYNIYSDAAK